MNGRRQDFVVDKAIKERKKKVNYFQFKCLKLIGKKPKRKKTNLVD